MKSKFPFKQSLWSILSLTTFCLGIFLWVLYFNVPSLNISFDQGIPIWVWTMVINPIGVVFGVLGLFKKDRFSVLLIMLNIIMAISIIPMIFLITIISGP